MKNYFIKKLKNPFFQLFLLVLLFILAVFVIATYIYAFYTFVFGDTSLFQAIVIAILNHYIAVRLLKYLVLVFHDYIMKKSDNKREAQQINPLDNHLRVLNLEENYDSKTLRSRVKEIAKKNHPDLSDCEEEKAKRTKYMQRINESAAYLKNKLK